MTKLLLRIFVKNRQDTADPKTRAAIGKLAGGVGIFCNCLLGAAKLAAGVLTGSISVTADALNNLSDAVSSVVTFFGFRLAQHPADPEHPYGHARVEYISGLVVSALILMMGFELVKSSVSRIFQPETLVLETAAFVILILSVCVKLWMYLFNRRLGKMIKSSALKATAADSRNDAIATLAVLAGFAVNKLWQINVDGYVGLAVAVFILYSGIAVARETVSPLLGKAADPELVEKISKIILSHEKVLGIHDLLIHDYGPGKCYASVHAELSAQEDPLVCHDLLDDIEWDVAEALNVHLVIHYDPVMVNDGEWNRLRTQITELLGRMDASFSMHDFRLVKGAHQTKLVFDLMVPHAVQGQHRKLKEEIDGLLREEGIDYPTVIRFESQM